MEPFKLEGKMYKQGILIQTTVEGRMDFTYHQKLTEFIMVLIVVFILAENSTVKNIWVLNHLR